MTVRVGLVGAGYWGPNVARNLTTLRAAELRAVCDLRRERAEHVARDRPGVRVETDLWSFLADPDLDAVIVATPIATHHEIARHALAAGKHVLVEKPLATTAADCRDLIALAAERDRVLMVGHVFIYNAAVRRVREYILDGTLGDVLYVYSQRLNLGQVRSDANALWNFAPHDLSILRYWLGGDPEQVVARGYDYIQPGIEDVVFMTLDYPGGVGANVHISWLDPLKVRRMTVVGTEKMVVYDDVDADARITVYDKGVTKTVRGATVDALGPYETYAEFQLLLRAGDVLIPKVDFVEPLKVELQHFVDCILDASTPETDGEDGLQVVIALERAQAAIEASRTTAVAVR